MSSPIEADPSKVYWIISDWRKRAGNPSIDKICGLLTDYGCEVEVKQGKRPPTDDDFNNRFNRVPPTKYPPESKCVLACISTFNELLRDTAEPLTAREAVEFAIHAMLPIGKLVNLGIHFNPIEFDIARRQLLSYERLMSYEQVLPQGIPNRPYYVLESREPDIDRAISSLIEPGSSGYVIVEGTAGIGKTAIAVEIIRRIHTAFEKVVGTSAKLEDFISGKRVPLRKAQLNYLDLLDTIAKQSGIYDVSTLRSEQQKEKALSNTFIDKRFLIVVDNLEDADKAQEIVGKLGKFVGKSSLIVTTRENMACSWPHDLLSYDSLVWEDSLCFLEAEARRLSVQSILTAISHESDDLRLIHKITAGAPLALQLIVSHARIMPIKEIIRQFQNSEMGDLYMFLYKEAWEKLTLDSKNVLYYIALSNASVSYDELANKEEVLTPNKGLPKAIADLYFKLLITENSQGESQVFDTHSLLKQFTRVLEELVSEDQLPPLAKQV